MANVVLERQTEQRGGILKGCTHFSGFPEEEKLDRATWNREMGEEATTQNTGKVWSAQYAAHGTFFINANTQYRHHNCYGHGC